MSTIEQELITEAKSLIDRVYGNHDGAPSEDEQNWQRKYSRYLAQKSAAPILESSHTIGDVADILFCLASIEKFNDLAGNLSKPVSWLLEGKMLHEEVEEYEAAAHVSDLHEVKDALADLSVVHWGTVLKHGLKNEFWSILKAVCLSNETKFCKTLGEAEESVQHWKDLGEDAYHEYNNKYGVWVILNRAGKVRKSISYQKPKF